jgi:hypothetical protein
MSRKCIEEKNMKYDLYIRLVEEKRKDLLRQAEQYRLIQEALASRAPRANIWTRFIHWLGQLLSNVGCLLQTRFGGQVYSPAKASSFTPCEERA